MPVQGLFEQKKRMEIAERYLDGGHSKTSIAQEIYQAIAERGLLLDSRQGQAYHLAQEEARAIGNAVRDVSTRRKEPLMGFNPRDTRAFADRVIEYLKDIRQDGNYELPHAGKPRAGMVTKFSWPRLWSTYQDAVNKEGQDTLLTREEFGAQFSSKKHDIRRFEREFNRCSVAGELETIDILKMIRTEMDRITFHKGNREPECSPEWHDRALQSLGQSEQIQDRLIIAALGYDTHGKAATCYD